MRHAAAPLMLCFAAIALAVPPAAAQVTEVPTFAVSEDIASFPPDVAVGTDGSLLFLWPQQNDNQTSAFARHFSADGNALEDPHIVSDFGFARDTAISARPDGTFLAAWHFESGNAFLYGRRLDATGNPLAPGFRVNTAAHSIDFTGLASLPSGSVFLWSQLSVLNARRYDALGAPRGPQFTLGFQGVRSDVAALPDGGFIVAWQGLSEPAGPNVARVYDPNGVPRGPAFSIGSEFAPRRVASNPAGDVVITGIGTTGGPNPGGVWMRRFDVTGAAAGNAILVHQAYEDDLWSPDVELDFDGNVLVAWAGIAAGTGNAQRVQGRAYSASDAPLGHAFTLANVRAGAVRVSRLADGHFVTVWNPTAPVSAKFVSLCLPAVAQCGDGILHPECEECDDGLANSDTAPDACRTDCTLPQCRDGVVDGAEECDDGNATNCDGCSVSCVAEPGVPCGDGVAQPSCAQPCDDANATVGDGCTSQCTLEPIAGGGSSFTDCRAVWVVDNPSNEPLLDKHGAFRAKQRCVDDDPSCDFDGGTPGSCTFRVRVCSNASGLSGCQLGFRLAAWLLDRPSAKQAAAAPALTAVRDAFAAVPAAILGPTSNDVCTDWLPITLSLNGVAGSYRQAKLTLKSTATTYDGFADKDQLRLTCVPASS